MSCLEQKQESPDILSLTGSAGCHILFTDTDSGENPPTQRFPLYLITEKHLYRSATSLKGKSYKLSLCRLTKETSVSNPSYDNKCDVAKFPSCGICTWRMSIRRSLLWLMTCANSTLNLWTSLCLNESRRLTATKISFVHVYAKLHGIIK